VVTGVIRVQSVWLDQPDTSYARLFGLLSADEQTRASRFIFDRDRRHYVVCRGALREALGQLLDRDPASLAFTYSERGKPALSDTDLDFNVSHSAGLALFAFSADGPIGVDVEHVQRLVDAEALASRFFSPDETEDLLTVTAAERAQAFFNCWTRKESYIKAIGDGLSCPLDSFSVTLRPGSPAAIRRIDGDDATQWQLATFAPADGYVASVAARQQAALTIEREWDRNLGGDYESSAPSVSLATRGQR
jgi:4'-phosphopantetheinyl transferase